MSVYLDIIQFKENFDYIFHTLLNFLNKCQLIKRFISKEWCKVIKSHPKLPPTSAATIFLPRNKQLRLACLFFHKLSRHMQTYVLIYLHNILLCNQLPFHIKIQIYLCTYRFSYFSLCTVQSSIQWMYFPFNGYINNSFPHEWLVCV